MKRLIQIGALLAATSAFSGFGQGVVLNNGDIFTFEFNDFHFESHLPVPTDPYTRVLLGKQEFTGSFLFEAFEDSTAQAPLFSASVVAGVNPSSDFYFGPAWSDLKGVIRVAMESGSMRLPVFLGAVVTAGGDVYSQSVTPIPEPSALALLIGSAAPLLFMHRRRHRLTAEHLLSPNTITPNCPKRCSFDAPDCSDPAFAGSARSRRQSVSSGVMQTPIMKLLSKAFFLSVLLVSLAAHAQGLLVGPATRNGSFEDGAASPWGGIATVSQDTSFASDGEWFATVQSTLRTDSWQFIPVDLLQGGGFIVSFDARTGAPAFDSISVYVNARNADGTYPGVYPAVTLVSSPTLSSDTWSSYETHFLFPDDVGDWDGSNIRLGLGFSGGDGMATYYGYFDNIVLEQIPEPCSLSLLVLGLGALACQRRGRACITNRSTE